VAKTIPKPRANSDLRLGPELLVREQT